MRDGSNQTGDDPKSAGVSKGRRHNVRAPARPNDADQPGGAAHPQSDSQGQSSPSSPASPGKTNDDDATRKR